LVPGNRDHLYSHLAFAASGRAVRTVVIDGVAVMEDRELLTVDEDEVMAEANEAFVRVLEKAGVRFVRANMADRSERDRP